MRVLAIIQARTTSIRFPNKVLQEVCEKPLIQFLLERLELSKKIDKIVVAIPKDQKEKILKNKILSLGYEVYEGSKQDVLDRYYKTAKKFRADIILRVTGDCPLVDPKIADKLINDLIKLKLDFTSNCFPPTYPDGLDLWCCTIEALEKAWKNSTLEADREHVMSYIGNNKSFNKKNLEIKKNYSRLRWTIDEPEDFLVLKNIIEFFHPKINFSWQEIMKLKKDRPKLFKANEHIQRDEGSKNSSGQKLYKKAKKIISGGGMLLSKRPEMFLPKKWPSYFSKAKGCYIWDLEEKKYTDMSIMGIGTNILGYGNPVVDEAVKKVVVNGNMSTFNCPEEVYLAEKLIKMHQWADMVKFTRTGGEANAVAIRIARAASKKNNVAVCGYHGWHDWYLSANLNNSNKLSEHLLPGLKPNGVPKGLKNTVFPFSYNNLEELENLIKKNDIGIIKMEVLRNQYPKNNFLKKVRNLATKNGIILIFDECTSGFRQSFGGLHKIYKVNPDIAIFGKALGNGYAINAIIGKKHVMNFAQSTFISSTFWTERIGPTAGLKTLEEMEKINSWDIITQKGKMIRDKWQDLAKKNGFELECFGLPSLSRFRINSKNFLYYKTFITQEMLKKNFLAADSIYLSTAHTTSIINKYFDLLDPIFKTIGECENGRNIKKLLETDISHTTFERLN